MRTIADVVEGIIERSPYLSEMLMDDLANNASVARKIQPDVEAALLEEVSLGAISMALHRLSKNLRSPIFGTRYLPHISGITLRSNLIQYVCSNFSDISKTLIAISDVAREHNDVFVNFSRGIHESILIVSSDLEPIAQRYLKDARDIKKIDGLSAITMKLPDSCLGVPGVYYPLLKVIAQEGISLVEVMSVRAEFSIILADEDIERGFSAIKRVTSA